MSKTRLLAVTEATFLQTGFSTYGRQLLQRLHDSGEYEVLELGCYGHPHDRRSRSVPWRYVPNMPDPDDAEGKKVYESDPVNEWGKWKFEECVLQWKVDCTISFRDPWMDSFIGRSPLRPFFRWVALTTVDAESQQEEWLDDLMSADAVLTYSDWGREVLDRESNGSVPTRGSVPGGVDYEAFSPVPNRATHRLQVGLDPAALIVGFCARNQARKLFPDLLVAFRKFLDTAPEELTGRAYLYLHTAYPDLGWDLPRLLNETGLANRTLFTYACQACGQVFPTYFQDARTTCPRCGRFEARLPNSQYGIPPQALGAVYNLMDVYVQVAVGEGLGYPQVEAAACEIPVLAVDYSAMGDVVRKVNGVPIDVIRHYREAATMRRMALPDLDDLVRKLVWLLSLPEEVLRQMGAEARQGAISHFSWDATFKRWDETIQESLQRPVRAWNEPPRLVRFVDPPGGLPADEFVRRGMHAAGWPELAEGRLAQRMARDLNWGVSHSTTGGVAHSELSVLFDRPQHRAWTRDDALRYFRNLCEWRNAAEVERSQFRSVKP